MQRRIRAQLLWSYTHQRRCKAARQCQEIYDSSESQLKFIMTLQNRVDPWGRLHANPSKSATRMGNRGILHDSENNIVRPWAHKGWVSCLISFKGIQRPSHFRRGIIPSCFSWMKRLPFLPGIDRAHIANEIAAMRSEKHGYRLMSPTRPSLIPSGCHK